MIDTRLPPFILQPQEQRELDAFLARWERISDSIKQYHADFDMWKYDATVPGIAPNTPYQRPFGSFRFISPDKFVYYIEGERINGNKVKRDDKANVNVLEEKIIIDNQAVYYYDYNAKKVRKSSIPPEMIRKGFADSPLPLIFGAKAADLKKRFSMKLTTRPDLVGKEIWLEAIPLNPEDQQEFRKLEIHLDNDTLRAKALKKEDINGKAYDAYVFNDVKIYSNFVTALSPAIIELFTPNVPRGWQVEVTEMPAAQAAMPTGPTAQNPQQNVPRRETLLYSP